MRMLDSARPLSPRKHVVDIFAGFDDLQKKSRLFSKREPFIRGDPFLDSTARNDSFYLDICTVESGTRTVSNDVHESLVTEIHCCSWRPHIGHLPRINLQHLLAGIVVRPAGEALESLGRRQEDLLGCSERCSTIDILLDKAMRHETGPRCYQY